MLPARVLRDFAEEHYRDACYYDHAYRMRKADVRFYVSMAQRTGGPVLELGVGTGRVALAIAREGIEVVGVDRMAEMLRRARERIERLPHKTRDLVTLVRGDLRTVRLGRRFPLVISPFNVFMHLYARSDIERALATAKAHLRPRGQLVLDVLNPSPSALARGSSRAYRSPPVVHPSTGRRYLYAETFEYDAVHQIQLITIALRGIDDPSDFRVTRLAHRQFFPTELDALLHYNGFSLQARYGGFAREPFASDSESQVIVARPAVTGPGRGSD